MEPWRQYQHDVAAFYRSIDMRATVDVRAVSGARASHDVDVLVEHRIGGVDVIWIIECKMWERPVSKQHVLALQSIVADVGADRGVLVSDSGFQAGAFRAAVHSNITLTSLADLRENVSDERLGASIAGLVARAYRATERVSILWLWPAPLVKKGPFDVNDVLEAAGPSLELNTTVLPHLHNRQLPVVFSNDRIARTHEDAMAIASGVLDRLEADISGLEVLAAVAGCRAREQLEDLRQESMNLFERGKQFPEQGDQFVESMRRLDRVSSQLMEATPEQVARAVKAIMHYFIDAVYLLPVSGATHGEWATHEQMIERLLDTAFSCHHETMPRARAE